MPDDVIVETALLRRRGFRWGAVEPRAPGIAQEVSPPAPDLGPLVNFIGAFKGNGFNTIFRPQDFGVTPTTLPSPATEGNNDNILELNLTQELLSFSPSLGSIPNRGMVQGDIFLNGVPYLQTISDITDPNNIVGIHFEPGVWLSFPQTTAPTEGPTLARLASIPHGTTINAQGTSSSAAGAPTIPSVDITPVLISDPTRKIPFPSQDVTKNDTFRLPQDLSAFVANGSITQPILTDPNTLLRNRIGAQNITSTITIQIATNPPPPDGLFGGGTANVAFLLGDNQAQKPNADAVRMAATFWIETVTEQITVPPCNPGHPVTVQGDASAGNPVPSFIADPPHAVNRPFNVSVTYTQIQYSQLVILNFNGLSWPHASVATLVPNDPIAIPQNAFPAPGDGHGDGDGDGHGDHDGNHGHNGGRGRSG